MALIELAWQIYIFSLHTKAFVVTIDEPENHLHPSMQRRLMGNLIKAFPRVQFIVATHSPFIVSAVRESRIYVLKHETHKNRIDDDIPENQTRFISSVWLDSVSRAGTAGQILRDVLGLSTTYPEWVSDDIDRIVKKYQGRPFNEELLQDLRKELANNGLSDLYPDVTSSLIKK